jgi:RNA polymerase-binding transcription factor DksA
VAEQLHATRRAELRAQLEGEAERLRVQLTELEGDDGSLAFDDGFADSSQVTAERAEIDALAGRLTEALHEVEEALAKMDAGTYGLCESCGQTIGDDRLGAMPTARLCITCASKSR